MKLCLFLFQIFKWGLRGTVFVEMAAMLGMITWTTYEFYQVDQLAGNVCAWIELFYLEAE